MAGSSLKNSLLEDEQSGTLTDKHTWVSVPASPVGLNMSHEVLVSSLNDGRYL